MCRCQQTIEKTGCMETIDSISQVDSACGHVCALINCIHQKSWVVALMPGDPLYESVARVMCELFAVEGSR